MVITMLPVGDVGKLEVMAEESGETVVFPEEFFGSAVVVEVATAQDFLLALNSKTIDYRNGIIISLKASIDLEGDGIALPSCPVGIDMGEYDLTNVGSISAVGEQSLVMSDGYRDNLLVKGSGDNVFGFYSESGAQTYYTIYRNMQVVFSGVDVQNVVLTAEAGSAFGYNNFYYALPESSDVDQEFVIYDSNMGAALYRSSSKFVGDMQSIYVDDIYVKDGVTTINPTAASEQFESNCKFIYTTEAISKIPSEVTLIYDNDYFIEEYKNPGVPFMVDNQYGIYSVSSDNTTMTVYGVGARAAKIAPMYAGATELYFMVNGPYTTMVEDEYGTKEITCKKVIFAEGSIPETVDYVSNLNTPEQRTILEIYIQGGIETEFELQLSNRSSIPVVNDSYAPVTVVDNDTEAENISKHWVMCDNLPNENSTEVTVGEISIGEGLTSTSGTVYEAGSKVTITPNDTENGTIYNVLFSRNTVDTWENVTYKTDGSVEITIPNFSSTFSYSVGTIEETTEYSVADLDGKPEVFTEEDETNIIHGYMNNFIVSPSEGYLIAEPTNDSWSEEIEVSEERNAVTKTYYVINQQTMVDEKDMDTDSEMTETIPVAEYGKISKFSHTYTLDTTTPTITSVTATDANGNAMTLDGGWLEEIDTVSAETVWTNTSSITLKATANAGSGLPVAGYMFDGENWQTSNTYTYTGEGVYDIAIHARDEFDVKIEEVNKTLSEEEQITRPETGIWVSSVGIDTTAPKLMFTDGKNATASELKSNAQYEGNLHVVCDDGEGSGFASINLYKKNGSEWTLSNELLIATEDASFIAPTTQNEVYKLEVTDIAGNTNVYENITVVGYVQDVEITVGDVTGVYGEDLEIEVTVKNISENPLSISAFGLREDATDDVFEMEANVVTELASGESFTTKILVAKGANAGDYTAMLDMEYINMDADAGQRVSKVNSQQITATIEKAAGTASVSVENITYGQKPEAIVASTTNGTENVTIYYRPAAAADSEYTTEAPVNAGEYKVKAVFAATANYNEVEATAEFTIAKATGTGTVSVENLYYGQTVSTTVSSDTNGTDNVTVYYKRAEEDDSTYTTEVPRRVGTYKVKAVFAETANYTELVVEGEFTITRISETRGMYSISSPNRDGVYEGPVVITGMDGNLVSVSEQNGFKEQIVLNGSIDFFRFFIKTPDGAITEAVILRNIVIKEPPVKVTAGRAHLDTGAAYELGEGTWNVSGDSTNYVGGTVFYVPESGDYEFTQQEGGQ